MLTPCLIHTTHHTPMDPTIPTTCRGGGPPMISLSWLDDDDGFESERHSGFRPHLEDPV